MRGKLLLSIVYVLGGASAALAQEVITNVSTGIDSSGNLLADSQADNRYTLFVNADDRGAPVAIPAGFPIPPWLANSATSRWIGLNTPSANGPPGFYEFDITVTLTADQAERAVLTGSWSTDNTGVDILINFVETGTTTDGNFGQLHAFPPNLGLGLFQEGENTITFVLENAGTTENPAGLRVDGAVVVIRNVLISPLRVAVTVGDPDVTMQVQIPVGSNDNQAVTVTVITSEPAVAVPVGAAADRIVLTFPAGGPLAQTFDLQLGRSGTATIVLENDAGLDNTQAAVLVQPQAIPIFNISTGISEGGALLDQAVEDPRYVITEFVSIPDGFTFDTPATPVTVPDGFPIPPWVANTDTSRWIGPNAGAANGPPGELSFSIEVEIPDVFDAASAILVGSWATDNSGAILVNGTPAEVTGGGFGGLAALPDQAGAGLFRSGINTVTFVVTNAPGSPPSDNPAGLRVDGSVAAVVAAGNAVLLPLRVDATTGDPNRAMQVALAPGSTDAGPVTVRITSDSPDVAVPVGAVNGTLEVVFPQDSPVSATFALEFVGEGEVALTLENDAGLTNFGSAVTVLAPAATPERVRLVDVNTGLDADGVLLGAFLPDGRYTITAYSPTDQVPFDTPVKPATLPGDDFPIPPWIDNGESSRWIAPAANDGNGPAGEFTYTITIDLPPPGGYDLSTTVLGGRWSTDDSGRDVFINGTSTGSSAGGFTAFTPIFADTGLGLLQEGPNTFAFVVSNGGGPTGLRVDGGIDAFVADGNAMIAPLAVTLERGSAPRIMQVGLPPGATDDGPVTVTLTSSRPDVVGFVDPSPQVVADISTGYDQGLGLLLGDLTADDEYTVTIPGSGQIAAITVAEDGFPIPPWVANSEASRWIGVDEPGDSNGPPGQYAYEITFSVDPDVDPDRVFMVGVWGTDNSGADIRINGVSTGATNGGFGSLAPFPPQFGLGLFQAGRNTVTFVVENAGTDANPTGLRVEGEVQVVSDPLATLTVVFAQRSSNVATFEIESAANPGTATLHLDNDAGLTNFDATVRVRQTLVADGFADAILTENPTWTLGATEWGTFDDDNAPDGDALVAGLSPGIDRPDESWMQTDFDPVDPSIGVVTVDVHISADDPQGGDRNAIDIILVGDDPVVWARLRPGGTATLGVGGTFTDAVNQRGGVNLTPGANVPIAHETTSGNAVELPADATYRRFRLVYDGRGQRAELFQGEVSILTLDLNNLSPNAVRQNIDAFAPPAIDGLRLWTRSTGENDSVFFDAVRATFSVPGEAPAIVGDDSVISVLGCDLTDAAFETNEAVTIGNVTATMSDGSAAPGVTVSGSLQVSLDAALPIYEWLRLDVDVTGQTSGLSTTLTVFMAHTPLDVNGDGRTNISDATAFGAEFNGGKNPNLIDENCDGTVNIQDATAFGAVWNAGAANSGPLPPKP